MKYAFIRLWPALALALAAQFAHAADPASIGMAGQQRMLSQRLVKAWCQIGLDVQPALAIEQLGEAISRFESNLAALEPVAATPEARSALMDLRAAWMPLRAAVTGPVRQSDAKKVNARAEDVLAAAERLTSALQDEASAPVSRWVNIAGRQRMLSQRLAKNYMLRQWGIDNAALRDESDRVRNEFAGALASMQQQAADPALRSEIDKLALQWEWLHAVLATEGAEPFRLVMAESSEAVLQLADRVTRLYERAVP